MNEAEIFPVVLEVAAHAIFAVGILHLQAKVVTVFASEGLGNFFVAMEAFESRSACAKNVAGVALRGAGKSRVRFGQWTGGNLPVRVSREKQSNAG